MELRHLRYFVAVAEELHFRRAAERLHISQPPLSLQIAELERELGARLFDRTSQRVSLTEAGRALLTRARDVLDRAQSLRREVQLAAGGDVGELRIAFTQSSEFLDLVPDAIQRFQQHFPNVTFSLQQMKSADQIAAVGERRLDLGIARRPQGALPRGVELTPLCDDPLVLAIHHAHPLAHLRSVTAATLRQEAFILSPPDAASGLRELAVSLCRRAGFSPRVVQEAREVLTMLGLVAAKIGVAIVPRSATRIGVRSIKYIDFSDAGARSSLYLSHARGQQSRLVQAFMATIAAASEQMSETGPTEKS